MILINWLKDHLMGNSKFQRCKTNISVINKWQFSNLVRNILLFSKKFLFECKTRIALISLVNRASFLLFVFHYSFLFTMWFCLKRWLFRHLLVENGVYFRNHTLYSEYVQSVWQSENQKVFLVSSQMGQKEPFSDMLWMIICQEIEFYKWFPFFYIFGSILMSSLTKNTTWFRVTYWESASKAIKSRQVENRVFKRQFWSIFEFAACKNMDKGPLVLLILPHAFHFYAYMTLTCVWYYKKYAKCVQIWNMYCAKEEKQ